MGSWIRCKCDNLVHKNLFCGTGISVVVTEDFLDRDWQGKTADDLLDELIRASDRQLKCNNCGRILLLRETKDVFDVHFYEPDNENKR
jgi:hypothetical protein